MFRRFLESLGKTARIDPEDHAAQISPNRLESLGYALAGWVYMLRRQKNTRIMSVASVGVMALAFWLQIALLEWAVLILTITVVWLAEFLNAGIEAAVDVATSEYHPMGKVAKDVASAAVLLSVIAAVLIGLLLLGPPLWEKLQLFA